ncbi:MAG: efflux RND transporter periplasmic adaptor subunit [Gammaproteobacteria bacterium]
MKTSSPVHNSQFLGQLISLLVLIALVLWLTTGTVHTQPKVAQALTDAIPQHLSTVTAEFPKHRLLQPALELYGQTVAHRAITIRAQHEAVIIERLIEKGARVKAGDVLARFDPRDLPAQLAAATASVEEQQAEYHAAQRLKKQDLIGQTRLAQVAALLANAKAQQQKLAVKVRLLDIRAPFDGVINAHYIEEGDFVQIGKPLFDLIDISPLHVTAELSEQSLSKVKVGQTAQIQLRNGDALSGIVHFIGAEPNATTRTYPIDVLTQSSDIRHIGMSATLVISMPEQTAFLISPALLQLDAHGKLGVKTLIDISTRHDNTHEAIRDQLQEEQQTATVNFQPVNILRAETEGIWVNGLTPSVAVITIGQGYVTVGERVIARVLGLNVSNSITTPPSTY